MKKVFISFSSKNQQLAENIAPYPCKYGRILSIKDNKYDG